MPTVSAPTEVAVVVAQRHIDAGIPNSAGRCAHALAIREQFPYAAPVLVMQSGTLLIGGERYFCASAHEWLKAFDRHQAVYPDRFVYTLVE